MTSKEFIIWMKGFMEACNDFTATPKQWDRIKEVLYEVDDNELESSYEEPESEYPTRWPGSVSFPLSGSLSIKGSSSAISVWTSTPNDISFTLTSGSTYVGPGTYTYDMPTAKWTYSNGENKKQQLND